MCLKQFSSEMSKGLQTEILIYYMFSTVKYHLCLNIENYP